MLWLGWRQQRTETLITAAFLVVVAVVLLPTGFSMAAAYRDGGLGSCLAVDTESCRGAIDAFATRFARLGDLLAWLTIVPGVIGALLAAPLVQQLEHRTYRLDWTQSITRGRWLAGKLGLAIATALITAIVLTLLVTWWRAPWVRLQGRMQNSVFDSEGTVVAAYTLFALGLAAAIGAVWRRAVPALIVAFAGYFAVRLFVDTWLRQRLMDPVATTWAIKGHEPNLRTAWVLNEMPVGADGQPFGFKGCAGEGACRIQGGALEPTYMHTVYHPASHFWGLQLRETALFAGAAIVLLAFAFWWTHRRAA
jgi:hypothetical protein